jgi:hypothetical protein
VGRGGWSASGPADRLAGGAVLVAVEPLDNINSVFVRMRGNKIDGRVVLKL